MRTPSRREWLASCTGSVLVGLAGPRAWSQPASAVVDWPVFRGEPLLRGCTSSALAETLKLLWSFESGGEPTSPIVSGGRVYVATREGDIHALALQDGKPVFKLRVDAGFEAAPTWSSGRLLVPDLEGVIHAFDASDGRKAWSHATEAKSEIKASVVVDSGVAIVGSYDGTLHALNFSDGARKWTHESEAQIHSTCAVRDGVAFVAGCDGHFRGLDVTTGKTRVDIRFGGYTAASPAISGDIAVFGTFSNEVVGIDLAKASVIWRYVPKKLFPFYSSAAIFEGQAFTGSRDKSLHVLDVRTGALAWTFETQGKIDSSPSVSGTRVFFGSHDGRIRGVDVKTRKGVFSYETGAPISTAPAIAENRLVVASGDGRILCFG